jgi:hypothetical protein
MLVIIVIWLGVLLMNQDPLIIYRDSYLVIKMSCGGL